jgi:hypothetical protein
VRVDQRVGLRGAVRQLGSYGVSRSSVHRSVISSYRQQLPAARSPTRRGVTSSSLSVVCARAHTHRHTHTHARKPRTPHTAHTLHAPHTLNAVKLSPKKEGHSRPAYTVTRTPAPSSTCVPGGRRAWGGG